MNPFSDLNRLEFAITYRCNAHCRHCQVDEDRRASDPAVIDPGLAVRVVRQVAAAYPLHSLMTWGGEPLLYPDIVCAIHSAAREAGIPHRSIITNAGVPRREDAFRRVARRLAESGVVGMWISVDAFHQEHIPLEVVERNVRALAEAGIEQLVWNPCWVVGREHDNAWNHRTRETLRALAHLPVIEDEGNVVQPDGRARRWLQDFLPPRVARPVGSCGDMPYTSPLTDVGSISIEPDGRIAICWDLDIGNAGQGDVAALLQDYDLERAAETRAIVNGGMAGLVALAHERGIDLDPEGYYSVCDMCRSLRREMEQIDGGNALGV